MDKGGIRRRLAVCLALVTASGLLAIAVPAQAHAAPTRCEGRKVRTYSFSTGTLHVYKKGGYVCAVTYAKNPGRKQRMMVSVRAYRATAVTDEGRYSRRAGPVTVHAGHRCVWVKGKVGGGSVSKGWILC